MAVTKGGHTKLNKVKCIIPSTINTVRSGPIPPEHRCYHKCKKLRQNLHQGSNDNGNNHFFIQFWQEWNATERITRRRVRREGRLAINSSCSVIFYESLNFGRVAAECRMYGSWWKEYYRPNTATDAYIRVQTWQGNPLKGIMLTHQH